MTVGYLIENPLSPTTARLALRLTSGSRAGQMVRWAALRCRVGSGAEATLRLRAVGIEPLHCWLLRTPRGTCLQRVAESTSVNGRSCQRQWLNIGDQLRIGPLEFQVILDEAETPAAMPSAPGNGIAQELSAVESRLDSLESVVGELQQEGLPDQEPLLQSVAEPIDRPAELPPEVVHTERWNHLETVCAQTRTEFAALEAGLIVRLGTIESQVGELGEHVVRPERIEQLEVWWQTSQGRIVARLEQIDAALDLVRQLALRPPPPQDDSRWQAACEKLRGDLGSACTDLVQRLKHFDAALAEVRQIASEPPPPQDDSRWQAACEQIGCELSALQAGMAGRMEPIERVVAELRRHSDETLLERHDYQRQLIRLQAQWIERSDLVGEQLARFDNRIDTLERQTPGATGDVQQERSEQIDHRLAELRAEREAFEQERRQNHFEHHHGPNEHARQMTQRLAEIQAERQALEWERDEQDSNTQRAERRLPRESPVELIEGGDEAEQVEGGESPNDSLQALVGLADSTHPTITTISTISTSSSSALDEDESIDNYMARLLQRVRGQTPASAANAPEPEAPSILVQPPLVGNCSVGADSRHVAVPVDQEAAEDHVPTRSASCELPKLQRIVHRSLRGEQGVNLSAMRDLANLSTRSALDSHARRALLRKRNTQLAVSVAGLGAGITLAGFAAGDVLTLIAAAISTAAGIFWGVHYLNFAHWHAPDSAAEVVADTDAAPIRP